VPLKLYCIPSGTHPEGSSSQNNPGKVTCKIQSLLTLFPVLESSSSEHLSSIFTFVILLFMLVFCQRQFLAVRVKQAGSGMFPSGTSSPTNAYRLFKSSQARGPESDNAHLELNDIHDAQATNPSILFFYSSRPWPVQSLRTCFLMVRLRFSAGYL
jgi:hypothetical protein